MSATSIPQIANAIACALIPMKVVSYGKFCENWGAQLSNATKFCASCGKDAGTQPTVAPLTSSKRSSPTTKWILGGVGLLAILSAGALFYSSRRVSKNAKNITRAIPDVSPILKALDSPASQPTAASQPQPLLHPRPPLLSTKIKPLLLSKANARSSAKKSSPAYSEPTSLMRTPTRQAALIKEMDRANLSGRKHCGREGANL